jgi:flagellar export protein FliJ
VKRYRNRLQRVLDVRRIQEDRAKAQVREAQAEKALMERLAQERHHAYNTHDPLVATVPYLHHRADRTLHELRALSVVGAEERVEASREQVVERLREWSLAARRVEALERLDARRRAEHQLEADREAEAAVDDLVSGRAARRIAGDSSREGVDDEH